LDSITGEIDGRGPETRAEWCKAGIGAEERAGRNNSELIRTKVEDCAKQADALVAIVVVGELEFHWEILLPLFHSVLEESKQFSAIVWVSLFSDFLAEESVTRLGTETCVFNHRFQVRCIDLQFTVE
jgi:hypothetical protein